MDHKGVGCFFSSFWTWGRQTELCVNTLYLSSVFENMSSRSVDDSGKVLVPDKTDLKRVLLSNSRCILPHPTYLLQNGNEKFTHQLFHINAPGGNCR